MTQCPACLKTLIDESRSCPHCGATLNWTQCSTCSKKYPFCSYNPQGADKCPHCNLSTEPIHVTNSNEHRPLQTISVEKKSQLRCLYQPGIVAGYVRTLNAYASIIGLLCALIGLGYGLYLGYLVGKGQDNQTVYQMYLVSGPIVGVAIGGVIGYWIQVLIKLPGQFLLIFFLIEEDLGRIANT